MDRSALEAALTAFTSPVAEFRHWTRLFYYTEGVAFLAEHAGAKWLLDYIAAHQKVARKDHRLRELQRWIVRRTERHTVRIGCYRESGDEAFHASMLLLGEFPLDEVTLYLEADTLMLPTERRI